MTQQPPSTTPSGTRRQAILHRLAETGRVEVIEMAGELGVADETIRRDLRLLEASAHLQRVHGGAVRATALTAGLVGQESTESDVHALAVVAAQWVPAQGSIFLGAGPIAEAIAAVLPNSADLTVVTSSVGVALIASRKPDTAVVNLGGQVDREDGSLSGQWARESLERLHIDLAFLTPSGVTPGGELLAGTMRSAAILSEAMRVSTATVMLGQAADFGTAGLMEFGRLDELSLIVTDSAKDDPVPVKSRERGIALAYVVDGVRS